MPVWFLLAVRVYKMAHARRTPPSSSKAGGESPAYSILNNAKRCPPSDANRLPFRLCGSERQLILLTFVDLVEAAKAAGEYELSRKHRYTVSLHPHTGVTVSSVHFNHCAPPRSISHASADDICRGTEKNSNGKWRAAIAEAARIDPNAFEPSRLQMYLDFYAASEAKINKTGNRKQKVPETNLVTDHSDDHSDNYSF